MRIIPQTAKQYSICYVEFSSDEDVAQCLTLDRTVLEGRTLFVAKSKPPEKETSDDLSKTLFLNNLPFGLIEEELKKSINFCKPHVKEVRLKKSYAFVKFSSQETARKALKTLKNNFKIKGRKIIAKAAEKKSENGFSANNQAQNGQRKASLSVSAYSGQESEEVSLGKRKPKDESQEKAPKNLEKIKDETEFVEEAAPAKPVKKGGFSNNDFRKMLLKK